ncbi:MAG: hypothetical protein II244_02835 [Clostridia bacterium]|nr:hypothetical protein [Clostridia bacterium]
MNNEFFTKTTNYKILGKTLFTKEEIFSGVEYQGQIYQISVSKDYYNSEFKTDEKKKEQ